MPIRIALLILMFAGFCLDTKQSTIAQEQPRVVHAFVALADNEHQGIVPVPKTLGNGADAAHNLYWGAAYGVRTFFRNSADWKEVLLSDNPSPSVLQRSIFLHRNGKTFLVADAYRGTEIRTAIEDFFRAAAGEEFEMPGASIGGVIMRFPKADLAVYVGHDGLMDFVVDKRFQGHGSEMRAVIVLACASKQYFSAGLRPTGAQPLLWTTGLMAPEAYTLEAALETWIAGGKPEQVRQSAANAYAKYQRISVTSAERLFATGW